MRRKHGSQCHERSCAALTIAMAAAMAVNGGAVVAAAALAAPTASVGAAGMQGATAYTNTALAFAAGTCAAGRLVSPKDGKGTTLSSLSQRTQAFSIILTAPPKSIPTTRIADLLQRRRRHRPLDGGGSTSISYPRDFKDTSCGDWSAGNRLEGIRFCGGIRGGVGNVISLGWHPAAEPDEDSEDTHYDNWRKMRVEELVKDQFLTPGRVNEIMDPSNVQRHEYNTNPDSSFGAVFQLDTLVDVIPGLIYPAWLEVARALNQTAPSLNTVQKGYGWTPEQMFIREFNWRLSQEELEGGIEIYDRTILRRALKYQPEEIPGSRRWLETLRRIPMPMAVLSRLPSSVVDSVLEKTDLAGYFPHRVTKEDEPFDDYRGYMLAALKVQRSTMKCCAFDCRQEGMIKAHDADMRGVCKIGIMAAWELRLADYSVGSFDDMTILDFRQLFADREFEPGMLELELEPEAAPRRKTAVATKVEVETETRRWDDDEGPETLTDWGGGNSGDGRRAGGGGLRR